MSLGVTLLLCSFSEIIVVSFPLVPITYSSLAMSGMVPSQGVSLKSNFFKVVGYYHNMYATIIHFAGSLLF